jgi:hypothetical protein
LLEKKDSQLRHQPEDPHALPPNLEKSDFFEKKDHQRQLLQEHPYVFPPNSFNTEANHPRNVTEDPHALPPNPEKSDLLEKKDNQAQLILEDLQNAPTFDEIQLVSSNMPPNAPKSDLVFNQPQHPPEKPQPLLLNPGNPDLVFQKDNQPRGKKGEERPTELLKPESQQKQTVLGNTKVEQEDVRETHTPIKQHIKKSLISIKELFQQRKQVELEKNPTVEKCVINGKTFLLKNKWDYDYKLAAVHYNVWKSIGKPKINTKTNRTSYRIVKPYIGEIKVEIVINNKKSIIPILVFDDPSQKFNECVYIVDELEFKSGV